MAPDFDEIRHLFFNIIPQHKLGHYGLPFFLHALFFLLHIFCQHLLILRSIGQLIKNKNKYGSIWSFGFF